MSMLWASRPGNGNYRSACFWAIENSATKIGLVCRLRESGAAHGGDVVFWDADRYISIFGKVFFLERWGGRKFGRCLISGSEQVFPEGTAGLCGEREMVEVFDHNFEVLLNRIDQLRESLQPTMGGGHLLVDARPYHDIALANTVDFVDGLNSDSSLKHDYIYYLFENVFYDSESVRQKQQLYLPFLNAAKLSDRPFLDLGCGRGEFLGLLKSEGIASVGVEINRIEVELLEKEGYCVHHKDLFDFLETDRSSWSGVSMIHVIEHLETNKVIDLFDALYERIEEGGCVVIETINPHCPISFASFFMDHTHVKPYAPEVIAFHLQRVGFKDVKILYTNLISLPNRVGEATRNYHDFGVIGVK